MNTLHNIQDKIQNSKAIDFGELFNQVIELFKKTWVYGLLLQIFNIIVMLPFIIVVLVPIIGLGLSASAFEDGDLPAVFGGLSLLYVLFFTLLMFVLFSLNFLLVAGFFRVMKHFDKSGNASVSDFFYYFKSKFFTKALFLALIAIVISVPAMLMCVLPFLYVMVPLSFFAAFFAFNEDLSGSQILSLSFKIGNKQWLVVFLFLLIYGVVSFILNLIPFINLLMIFVTSIVYHPIYVAYKKVVGFEDFDPIDEIGMLNE